MQLSKRLSAVAAMVTPGSALADIGTDHAYIPICLAEAGKIAGAIAGDVNVGPLQKAEENIRLHGLEEKIETRLSDGLAALRPGEADSIVIAGMGGPLTVRILTDGRAVARACRELILQPQSDIRQVRFYLEQEGWQIVRENMVVEDGKFYPMMKAVRTGQREGAAESNLPADMLHEVQLRYGPLLIRERSPVLFQFLQRERRINERILTMLAGQAGDEAKKRSLEVQREAALISLALDMLA